MLIKFPPLIYTLLFFDPFFVCVGEGTIFYLFIYLFNHMWYMLKYELHISLVRLKKGKD